LREFLKDQIEITPVPQKLKFLLFPIAIVYGGVIRLRNHLYNTGYKREISFDVMTIGVGNLVMGGTGKTPLTEYLIRLLQQKYKMSVLSRGYGRSSTDIKMVSRADTTRTIGDEPMQVFRKFGDGVVVAVGANRLLAIPQILQEHADVNLIVLDDVYQHRKVKPHINLLLTNYQSPFYFDNVFPVGWLREPRSGANRADAIIVSKCPGDLKADEMEQIKKSIRKYSHAPVFFSGLKYERPVSFGTPAEFNNPVVVVSAIANNYIFGNYCSSLFTVIRHFKFPDHHFFTEQELHPIVEFAKSNQASIVTTEKDMVKLIEMKSVIGQSSWFYLPMEIFFLKDEEAFNGMILAKCIARQSQQN
jgi:tetraacyldisaccharide 4'-kinase